MSLFGGLEWTTGLLEWTTGTLEWTTGILEWITGMATYLTRCPLGGKVGLGPDSNYSKHCVFYHCSVPCIQAYCQFFK